MLAADGCAFSSSDPACCFCGVWGPRRPEGVAVAMFGLSLVWACPSAEKSKSRRIRITKLPWVSQIAELAYKGGTRAK